MSCAGIVASLVNTRKIVDKRGARGKGWSGTGAQGYEDVDGWIWSGEHVDGLWRKSDWQTGIGSGWWTTANDWTLWES